MGKAACLALDNLDDRREIHRLLERLSPQERIRFLDWCCRQSTLPNSSTHPRVAARTIGTPLEIYFDIWSLAMQYGLDLEKAANRLVELVRQRG